MPCRLSVSRYASRSSVPARERRSRQRRSGRQIGALADELRASEIWSALIAALLAEVPLHQGRDRAARGSLDQLRSLTESKPPCLFEPEFLRVEAQWLVRAGQEDEARRLLLQAIATAQEHGSLALAIRAALALARASSAEHGADLTLLSELCASLPAENDTDYRRDAESFVGTSTAG